MRIGDGGMGDALGAGAVVVVAAGAAAGAGATDHTSAYLTFTGAILVAVITAVTTNRRQDRQLEHERDLRDLDDLRAFLDRSAQVFEDALIAAADYRGVREFPGPVNRERRPKVASALVDAQRQLRQTRRRFHLRFPEGHEVARTYDEAARALNEYIKAIQRAEYAALSDEGRARLDGTVEAALLDWTAFARRAAEVMGPRALRRA